MSTGQQGRVTSLFAYRVVRQVEPAEERAELLAALGLELEGPVDATRMLAARDYYDFLARCAKADRDGRSLPLRAGASMSCSDFGTFGLAWKAAADLRGSYDRAERYGRVLTNVTTYEVEPADEGAYLHLRREGERDLGLRLSNEASIASLAAISREATAGEFRPVAVFFQHPEPESSAAHEEHFGCPMHFGSDRDALFVSTETLKTPNRLGDADMLRFFDTHLAAEVERAAGEGSLDRELQLVISRALSEGVPALSDVARSLGMSGRTLQRRLSERGVSYQSVVDEARRRLARRMLRDTDSTLLEIAFMTGFAEQSSFSRAFRRWEGQTPRSYRLSSG